MPKKKPAGVPIRWRLAESERVETTRDEELVARAFGSGPADIDIDFMYGLRPMIVTHLLANCLETAESGDAQFWKWTVTRRMQGILAIAVATGGARRTTTADCRAPGCGKIMELDLDLERFRRPAKATVCTVFLEDGVRLGIRIPTGADQLRFAETSGATPETFAGMVVVDGPGGPLRTEWLPVIESALSEEDDLTAIELRAVCPWCGRENTIEFDLEGYLLRNFERRQRALLDAVHRVASAYHWSEREILAMPAHRRDYYLDRIDREVAQ